MVKSGQLLVATIVASLDIFLISARVTQMHKMLCPELRVVATKSMAIKAMVVAIVGS